MIWFGCGLAQTSSISHVTHANFNLTMTIGQTSHDQTCMAMLSPAKSRKMSKLTFKVACCMPSNEITLAFSREFASDVIVFNVLSHFMVDS